MPPADFFLQPARNRCFFRKRFTFRSCSCIWFAPFFQQAPTNATHRILVLSSAICNGSFSRKGSTLSPCFWFRLAHVFLGWIYNDFQLEPKRANPQFTTHNEYFFQKLLVLVCIYYILWAKTQKCHPRILVDHSATHISCFFRKWSTVNSCFWFRSAYVISS